MSIFRPLNLACPACRAKIEYSAVHSVNADRRPDLRAGIIDGTFQQEICPECGEVYRLDPEFNLLDTKRGQWLAAAPLAKLGDWVEVEKHARGLFDRAYGEESNPAAQEIGRGLTPRITFGWPAAREKVLASEYQLDDVVLELCKMFIMRNSASLLSADTELRLIDVVDGDLIFGWIITADETPGPTVRLARTVYEQIAADEESDWEELKETFADTLFVDLNRLLMEDRPVPEPAPFEPGPAAEEPADVAAPGVVVAPLANEEDEEEDGEGTEEGRGTPPKGRG